MQVLSVVQALGLGQEGERHEEAAHQNIMVSSKCRDVCAGNSKLRAPELISKCCQQQNTQARIVPASC